MSRYDQALIAAGETVDRSRPFIADSLTPLFYTDLWPALSDEQRLTYNQLNGTYWNELISWFEKELAMTVLHRIASDRSLEPELRGRLHGFLREEMLHAEVFRQLNLLSDPERYEHRELSILTIHRAASAFRLCTLAGLTPALLWLMLLMEERSIAVMSISAQAGIDPLYARVYAAHSEDEERHVTVDLCLLERLHTRRSALVRSANAQMFRLLLRSFLLGPGAAAHRIVALLMERHPELRPVQPDFCESLRRLRTDPRYHAMMYDRDKVPRAFARFDALEEMHDLRHVVLSYVPESV